MNITSLILSSKLAKGCHLAVKAVSSSVGVAPTCCFQRVLSASQSQEAQDPLALHRYRTVPYITSSIFDSHWRQKRFRTIGSATAVSVLVPSTNLIDRGFDKVATNSRQAQGVSTVQYSTTAKHGSHGNQSDMRGGTFLVTQRNKRGKRRQASVCWGCMLLPLPQH